MILYFGIVLYIVCCVKEKRLFLFEMGGFWCIFVEVKA